MFPSLTPIIRTIALPILDFIAPPLCFHCASRREHDRRGLCAACWQNVRRVDPADPLFREHAARVCADGLFEGLVVPYAFEEGGPIQSLLHELKYGEKSSIGLDLGAAIGDLLLRTRQDVAPCGVVPVPLHRSRLRERGYNQSALLACGIARVTGIPLLPDLLVRTRPTVSQTALDRESRKRNVERAFGPGRGTAPRRSGIVIVVDDVITSGSTLRACGEALHRAGFDRLCACAAALAS